MKTYTAPALTTVGQVEALTGAMKVGTNLDASFEAGTPLSQVTLS